jgi:hypothetical protein
VTYIVIERVTLMSGGSLWRVLVLGANAHSRQQRVGKAVEAAFGSSVTSSIRLVTGVSFVKGSAT